MRITFSTEPLLEGEFEIGGKRYVTVYDPKVLEKIRYPDGSRPTACALVEVIEETSQ